MIMDRTATGRRAFLAGLAAVAAAPATAALADALAFDAGWQEQRFPFQRSNEFTLMGDALQVDSDGGVSLLMRTVAQADWAATRASWRWSVARGVPATDLAVKGGDDRNLALYFAFLPRARAEALQGASARKVLRDPAARTLIYVWGGDAALGTVTPSPYLEGRGFTIAMRPAGTGDHTEAVDLAADYRRSFGAAPEALFGLAISADSDDTDTVIDARIENLRLMG
jgi:hypothetical protein